MRLSNFAFIGFVFTVVFAPAAHADLLVVAPGVIFNGGITDVIAAFTKATGVKVQLKSGLMSDVVSAAKATNPGADVAFLPMEPYNLMGNLALDQGIKSGTFTPIGRVEFGLAVRTGTPHPDISTPEKFIAVLKGAKQVMRSNPGSDLTPGHGSMVALAIYNMLQRPEFIGVHSLASTDRMVEGGMALGRGEGDMALQAVCEIINHPEISLVGVVPDQFYLHMDIAAGVGAHAADEKNAKAFLAFAMSPEARPLWKAKGIDPFD